MSALARRAGMTLATLIVLAAAGAAQATLIALEQALELPLASVRLPATESGQLVVRRCADCRPETLRVTAATRYFVHPGTAAVTLQVARKAAAAAATRPAALAYVYYEPGPRTVRRLVLDPGP